MFKSLMSKLKGPTAPTRDDMPSPPVDDGCPRNGNIYAFRTHPLSEFAALETNRYAAFKVLGVNEKRIAIGVIEGIWSSPPALSAVGSTILNEHRFAHTGQIASFGVSLDWWKPADLTDMMLLGNRKLSLNEKTLGDRIIGFNVGCRYSTLNAANHAAEGEWRWEHDREALLVESEKVEAKAAADRAAKEERYRTRLKHLTWEKLLSETPFDRWSPSPPFPSHEFTEAARETIRQACRDLRELGPKPPRAKARAILKSCVEWFNKADEAAGGVIETEEREDILAVLEEMAHVVKQKSLIEEIDEWKEW